MAGGVFLSSCFDQERLEIVKCRVKMSAGNGTVAFYTGNADGKIVIEIDFGRKPIK